MSDVETKLILRVSGQDQLKDLITQHDKLRESLSRLIQEHSGLDAAMRDPAIRQAADNLADLEREIGRVEKAIGGATRSWGNAAVQWSRATQDFFSQQSWQQGFGAIANNMELMVTSVGGPALLAGVATLAGTFGPMIVRKIAGMFESGVKEGLDHLGSLEDRLRELESKKTKLWVDYAEIEQAKEEIRKLKDAKQELDKLISKPVSVEQQSGKAVAEAIAESEGGREALGAIRDQMVEGAMAASPEMDKAMAEYSRAEREMREAQRREAIIRKGAGAWWNLRHGEAMSSAEAETRSTERRFRLKEDALRMARRNAENQAAAQLAEELKRAESGGGEEQAEAQRALMGRFGALGTEEGRDIAGRIEAASPAAMRRRAADEAAEKELPESVRQARKVAEELDKSVDAGGEAQEAALERFGKLPGPVRGMAMRALQVSPGAYRIAAAADHAARVEEMKKEKKKADDEKKRAANEKKRIANERKAALNRKKREKDREDRDRQRDEDDRIREAQKVADELVERRHRIGTQAMRDPGMRAAVEAAFVSGGRSDQIAPLLGEHLRRSGLATADDAPFAGGAAVGEVRDSLNRRMAGYVARGMDQTQAFAAVQAEVIAEFAKLDGRFQQMEQMLMNQRGMLHDNRQTRMSRGQEW